MEIIAKRIECDISDIEKIVKRRDSDAHIQNIG